MTSRLCAWLLVALAVANAAVLKRDVGSNDLDQQIGRLPELDLTRTSTGELANHTSAVIELVLQNVHRLKNFEERARLERLVTRFKTLVDELQKPPRDGATQLADELPIDDGDSRAAELQDTHLYPGIEEQQKVKFQNNQETKRTHESGFGLLSAHLPTHAPTKETKIDSANLATSTALPGPLNASLPVPQVVPTPKPVSFQREDDIDDDLDEDEDDELGDSDDIDDDELVKELRHGARPSSDSLHLEFVPPGSVPSPRHNQHHHRSDPAAMPPKSDNPISSDWQQFGAWPPLDPVRDVLPAADLSENRESPPQTNDDAEQVDNDVKLLNTVINNLRQVKEVLQRMRHNR